MIHRLRARWQRFLDRWLEPYQDFFGVTPPDEEVHNVADELKVGDRASTCFHEVTIIAIDGTVAFVRDEAGGNWCDHLAAFTRIESAEPQPLFRVGDAVFSPGDSKVTVVAVGAAYQTEYQDGTRAWWSEIDLRPFLEAVPVCPTCGGKVGE